MYQHRQPELTLPPLRSWNLPPPAAPVAGVALRQGKCHPVSAWAEASATLKSKFRHTGWCLDGGAAAALLVSYGDYILSAVVRDKVVIA